MGLRERDSAASEPVHVRRLSLRVPAESFDIIIQVVAHDEDDIRLIRRVNVERPASNEAEHNDCQERKGSHEIRFSVFEISSHHSLTIRAGNFQRGWSATTNWSATTK